jgi:DNA-binding response OmpR family regulator
MHSTYTPPLAATATPSAAAVPPELLLVGFEDSALPYASALRQTFHVTHAATTDAALRAIERNAPALIVTELAVQGIDGPAICRAGKGLAVPATVLVTTTDVDRVPDAILAGCDAVLLQPFAPNLLFARVGRLVRSRSTELRYRAVRHRSKAHHVHERPELLLAGTNQSWPETECPYCAHQGVTSFEFTSYRRAWYACLECRKVWVAKRQE